MSPNDADGMANSVDPRATENRFFAGPDRFLVCKTDSVCIKRFFFGPKNTLRGSYTGLITWISRSVKPLIAHNYSNYQCCQHIRVTESWKMRSRLITLRFAIILRRKTFAEFPVLELIKYSWRHGVMTHLHKPMRTWLASVHQFLDLKHRRLCWNFRGFQPRLRDLVQIFIENR